MTFYTLGRFSGQAFGYLPTGVRVFLILGAVLLPLTFISILASAETGRSAAQVRGERLLSVLELGAGRLRRGLVEDQVTVSASATSLSSVPAGTEDALCRRLTETIRARHAGRVAFVVADGRGRPACGLEWGSPIPQPALREQRTQTSNDQVVLSRRNENGWVSALRYPASEIVRMLGPVDLDGQAHLGIRTSTGALVLADTMGTAGQIFGAASLAIDLTGFDLSLEATLPELPPTAAQLIAILLPILMLIGSAVVGWFLVHRLFTRQLGFLTKQVSAYRPGAIILLGSDGKTGAREVQALGRGLRDMSQLVSEKIQDVEAGLERQTSLTREVHHRVKNNLQVIASLISLHSRAADEPKAEAAYRTIQRRVDALSVVHRNHHAGTEVTIGVSLSALLSELASSLQASTSDTDSGFAVVLCVDQAAVSQDVATSVAFLLTELAELALTVGGGQILHVDATAEERGWTRLTLTSPAYVRSDALIAQLDERYGRVLLGLSRQLREALNYDPVTGTYDIRVPTRPAD